MGMSDTTYLWRGAYDGGYREIDLVEDGLYLSGDSFTVEDLRRRKIRAVISVARECPDDRLAMDGSIQSTHFAFPDHVIMNLGMVESALRTLRALRRRGTVLVHCGIGVSRSPTIIALFWMAEGKVESYEEGIAKLKRIRPCVSPNRIVDGSVIGVVKRLRREWVGSDVRFEKVEVEEGRRS